MSKIKKAILIFTAIIILACVGLMVYKASHPVSLIAEPLLGPGIYHLKGIYPDKGLTTFYGNGLIWSPTGKYIAGFVNKYPYPDFCLGCGRPFAEIFIFDPAKGEKRTVLRSDDPDEFADPISWLPDGENIAYMTGDYISYDREIWSTNLNGKNKSQFMQESGDPIWSPDGSKIILLEKRPILGDWDSWLYILDLSTHKKQLVYQNEGFDFFISDASWKPDGKQIVFTYGQTKDYDILYADISLFDLESNEVSQVTNDSFDYLAAGYSPKNNLVALQRFDKTVHDFDHQYMTVIRDLTNDCEFVLPVLSTNSASWSPDGQKLVISVEGDAYIVDLAEYLGTKFTETGLVCP